MYKNNISEQISQVLQSISVNSEIKKAFSYIAQRKAELQSGGNIDLIQGRKSVEKGKRSKEERWEWKLEKARERLERKKTCGRRGCVGIDLGKKEVRYHPFSCGCVTCSYCAVRESRRYMRKYFEFFEEWVKKGKKMSFITLTVESTQDLQQQVDFISKSLRKLYDLKLFGRRNWKKIEEGFYKELDEYKRCVGEGGMYKVERQLRFFLDFKKRWESEIERGSDVRLGQIFNGVWKLEITYSPADGWHTHWHGIILDFIPKLLLTVLWKMVTAGKGCICDVRRVRGRKAVVELAKYTTKHWDLEQAGEDKVLEVEAVMYGRHRVRHWGMEWLEQGGEEGEEDQDKEYRQLWWVDAIILGKENLSGLWREVRRMKREGVREKEYAEVMIFPFEDSKDVRCTLYLRDDGELVIKDERVYRLLEEVAKRGDYLDDYPSWWGEDDGEWVEQVEIEQDIDEDKLPF